MTPIHFPYVRTLGPYMVREVYFRDGIADATVGD